MTTRISGDQIRDGGLLNVDIGAAAAIDWTKISKTGSSLADLITRSAGDLSSGTIPAARLTGRSLADLGTRDAGDLSSGTIPAARLTGRSLLDLGTRDAADLTGTLPAARLTGRSLADLGTRSAGDLNSGALLDARLSANVPLLNAANVFTAAQRINAGFGVNVAPPATGAVASSGAHYERSRTVPMGEWTDVAYDAANFYTNSAMTWTVDSGDQRTYAYTLIGKTLWIAIYLDTTSIAGTLAAKVFCKIPGSFLSAKRSQSLALFVDNGVAAQCYTRVVPASADIEIGTPAGTNMAASTNNTYFRVLMPIEVQ